MLVDRFLEEAIEVDVDAISDGKLTLICGVMEHIEEAGIHSGDSACALPPYSLPDGYRRGDKAADVSAGRGPRRSGAS